MLPALQHLAHKEPGAEALVAWTVSEHVASEPAPYTA